MKFPLNVVASINKRTLVALINKVILVASINYKKLINFFIEFFFPVYSFFD